MLDVIRRRMVPIVSWCIVALAFSATPREAHAQVANFQAVSVPGCNASSLAQIPGTTDMFVGRRLINTSSDPCSGSQWAVVLFRFDWQTQAFTRVKDLINPASGIGLGVQPGATITSAYDATVADVNGELWMAFECAGSGGPFVGGLASSCVAPLSRDTYNVDFSRTNVVVAGVGANEPSPGLSASVPKIFAYQGTPYLYWTAVEFRRPEGRDVATRIATRGAQLARNGNAMMWVAGTQSAWRADQGDEVLGSSSDGLVGDLADGFDVKVIDGKLLMTSGAGTTGCTSPLSVLFGCYRLQIRTSPTPLGNHVYNAAVVNNVELPFNPQEYSRFAIDPAGNWHIIGAFLPSSTTGSTPPAETVPVGQGSFPVTPSVFQFGSNDASSGANPVSGPNALNIPFETLQAINLGCLSANPRPGTNANSCASSSSRYCQSQGYPGGGILEEYDGKRAVVLCFRSHVVRVDVSVAQLTARNASCTTGNLFSDVCASAIAAQCTSMGFAAGGFGPVEYAGAGAQIACVDDAAGSVVPSTYTELNSYAACPASGWTESGPCISAVNRACMAKGYAGGYGILDHFGNSVNIGCAKGNAPL